MRLEGVDSEGAWSPAALESVSSSFMFFSILVYYVFFFVLFFSFCFGRQRRRIGPTGRGRSGRAGKECLVRH